MMRSVARLVGSLGVMVTLVSLLIPTAPLAAQCVDSGQVYLKANRRVQSLVTSITDVKWKDVDIYRVSGDLQSQLLTRQNQEDSADLGRLNVIGDNIYDETLPGFVDKALAAAARSNNLQAYTANIVRAVGVDDPDDLDPDLLDESFNLARVINNRRGSRARQFFIIATKDTTGRVGRKMIALVGVREDPMGGDPQIYGAVKAGADLYCFLNPNASVSTLYSEMATAVEEGGGSDLVNVTFVLRRLDEIMLVPQSVARATYLPENDFTFLMTSVSEGRPLRRDTIYDNPDDAPPESDYPENVQTYRRAQVPSAVETPYELALGLDVLASFRELDLTDRNVPKVVWGVDLRNNFDEINYPSIWGGRMTLNAIIENIRIGAVLPTIRLGGDSLDGSGIGSRQQKIIGGYGGVFSGDFAMPILQNSGLFNFYGSYTFLESSSGIRPQIFNEADRTFSGGDPGYLIRYAFQAFYSFGFYADGGGKHLFRMKFGGTVYGVDLMFNRPDTTVSLAEVAERPNEMFKESSETVGGVSGRLEYMKSGQSIPYGLGVQYNDQSILTNVWIQFVLSQSIDLKFEGKYFTPVFRDPHLWENPNNVFFSATAKYHF